METANLKASITTLLKETGYDVYEYNRVPKRKASGSIFPYVTYKLDNSNETDRAGWDDVDIPIEVDVLDYSLEKNTDLIEEMIDTISDTINRRDVIETGFYYRIEKVNMLTQLPTTDEFTFRRQFVGILHFYEGS